MDNNKFLYNQQEKKRIDVFLVEKLGMSRSQIKKIIDNQQVFVNDMLVKKSGLLLELDDKIEIKNIINQQLKRQDNNLIITPVNLNLEVIFEDEYILVINKPKNILVYPSEHNEEVTLVNGLLYHCNWNQNNFNDKIRMGIVHRLDKDTNGLMVVAKKQLVIDKLNKLFINHEINKHYKAIVYNHFNNLNKSIYVDVQIGYDKSGKYKMRIGNDIKNSKQAISIVTPLQNLNNGFCLVDVEILTGRTHQIRATMRYLNHPILNDPIYGPNTKLTNYGQYLMCNYLSFKHPITNQKLVFEIPFEKNFESMYEKLSK